MALSQGPVGFLPTQIHPWDDLMRRLCEELNDEEKEYLMQFYIREDEAPNSFETLVAERIGSLAPLCLGLILNTNNIDVYSTKLEIIFLEPRKFRALMLSM